ncbi:permease-like cell division protein FtsX [Guggenheimella bovis]
MRNNPIYLALRNISKNALMSIASIISVAFTLIMLGFVLLLLLNTQHATKNVAERFDTIRYEIPKGTNDKTIKDLQEKILHLPNVTDVELITKEEGLKDFIASLGEDGKKALAGLDENPLPDSFNIKIADIETANETLKSIQALDKAGKTFYNRDVANVITNISRAVRIVGLALILALLFITILSIVNTIRIGISNRRNEITIMRFIGATRGYIRGPFLVEGVILGILGAVISSLVLHYSYTQLLFLMKNYLRNMSSSILISDIHIVNQVILVNFIIGAGVGLLGSLFSMRKYLKA